ncbi:EAL domain-containing protein [Cognatishimia sp. SS12]|uniref:EAL domain-containing protein n=1 Tax=Cognatishimia sp. SS12 TaxID=2979465 RepID=UPI00232EE148|nr:EAL domain-containing protein [Cognatishimia sp. SS12]MDC0739071.1 EAL domain-containing protein [Cognatishimia sp. SS12]
MARRGNADQKKRAERAQRSNPLEYAVAKRDKSTLDMVSDAIAHKEVMLAFQPIVKANDPTKPAFYEGLLRVLDETGRIIPAKDFMSSVSDTEIGRKLDCLALEFGLQELERTSNLRLSINMSARSIGYRRWMTVLDAALRKRPDLANRLILEISEPSAMQVPELVMDFMDELQSKGIAFALDDYASDLTSFRYFKEFFFDILKIDGQFTRNIQTDHENQVLAGAMASIARQFDIFTVATRVETMEDASTLADLGFDCLQGFVFGAPTVNPPWGKNKNSKNAA